MKYLCRIAVIGALTFSHPARAQLIGGEVIDEETARPLVGFSVFLHHLVGDSSVVLDSVKTDRAGFFQMSTRAPGVYQLAFGMHRESLARGPVDTLATDTSMVARQYLLPVTRLSRTTGFVEYQVQKPAVAMPSRAASPRYPAHLRAQSVRGKVVASFVVDTAGRAEPKTFQVIETSHPDFAKAVFEAMPRMRFGPASIGGIPVRQRVQLGFEFYVDQD